MTTNRPHGTTCTQDGGRTCNGAAACLLTVNIVRVGFSGATALSNVASRGRSSRSAGDRRGVFGRRIAACRRDGPTHRNQAFTLSGTANSHGNLTLSGDGRYVVLAGFNRAVGSTSIPRTWATPPLGRYPALAARIDADGQRRHLDAVRQHGVQR